MVDARLTGLALLNIHREMSADLTTETVIDRFAKTKKRVLDFVMYIEISPVIVLVQWRVLTFNELCISRYVITCLAHYLTFIVEHIG